MFAPELAAVGEFKGVGIEKPGVGAVEVKFAVGEGLDPVAGKIRDDTFLAAFLDGLIISRRGPRDLQPGVAQPSEESLTNNLILRKLRIALEMNDADMLKTFGQAGVSLSKSELSALFRGVGQRNYKECGDQLLRNFVRGLTLGTKI